MFAMASLMWERSSRLPIQGLSSPQSGCRTTKLSSSFATEGAVTIEAANDLSQIWCMAGETRARTGILECARESA
jgi:hypothetical protein